MLQFYVPKDIDLTKGSVLMFRMLETVRDWIYPPKKAVVPLSIIDTQKPYAQPTEKSSDINTHAIREKISVFKEHYADYQLRDAILLSTTLAVDVAFYFLIYSSGPLVVLADMAFLVYGAPWFRQEYRKEHEKMLDELMVIYKWMATGFGPAVTQGVKKPLLENGKPVIKEGLEVKIEQPTLYIEMAYILAAFNNADKMDVWNGKAGEFSELYWDIMREPPHYKTKSLHAPDAIKPNPTAVVSLTKVMMRNWLYVPTQSMAPKESKQENKNDTNQVQEENGIVKVGNMVFELFNAAKSLMPVASAAQQFAASSAPKKNN